MSSAKVAITIDIQEAVKEKLLRIDKRRLTKECAKLDPQLEQSMADEGLSQEFESWPEY